jgi:hypothetical protein
LARARRQEWENPMMQVRFVRALAAGLVLAGAGAVPADADVRIGINLGPPGYYVPYYYPPGYPPYVYPPYGYGPYPYGPYYAPYPYGPYYRYYRYPYYVPYYEKYRHYR